MGAGAGVLVKKDTPVTDSQAVLRAFIHLQLLHIACLGFCEPFDAQGDLTLVRCRQLLQLPLGRSGVDNFPRAQGVLESSPRLAKISD